MDKKERGLSYKQKLKKMIEQLGGMYNAHAHLDRSHTNDPYYWEHAGIEPEQAATYPLYLKQKVTGELHKGPAYCTEDLLQRMSSTVEEMIAVNTKRLDTLIDATSDIGMVAIDAALKIKKKYKDLIEIRIGPQPIFGFKNLESHPERWGIFKEAAKKCDFIGGLPEKDDAPNRIGYDKHLKLILELGIRLRKEVHVHVDQGNDPRENGTETLIEAVRWLGSPKIEGHIGPTVWAVHSISPACYDEPRHQKLMENMKRYNLGLLCCPRGAVTMRRIPSAQRTDP